MYHPTCDLEAMALSTWAAFICPGQAAVLMITLLRAERYDGLQFIKNKGGGDPDVELWEALESEPPCGD